MRLLSFFILFTACSSSPESTAHNENPNPSDAGNRALEKTEPEFTSRPPAVDKAKPPQISEPSLRDAGASTPDRAPDAAPDRPDAGDVPTYQFGGCELGTGQMAPGTQQTACGGGGERCVSCPRTSCGNCSYVPEGEAGGCWPGETHSYQTECVVPGLDGLGEQLPGSPRCSSGPQKLYCCSDVGCRKAF